MANPAPTFDQNYRTSIQNSAWTILLAAFGVFCAIVTVCVYILWNYYSTAMMPVNTTLALKYVETGILVRQADRTVPQDLTPPAARPDDCHEQTPTVCALFAEGQHLIGRRGAGYGPVAALLLPDDTKVNLHTQPSGFDIVLERYRVSRWTHEYQDVIFNQQAGYARYDIANNQPYKRVSYAVRVGSAIVYLAPGGSYRIDVPRDDNGQPRGRLINDPPLLFEIAVRRGTALIESNGQTLDLRSNDKVQVNLDGSFVGGLDNAFQSASWELLSDGSFDMFSSADYNTPGNSTTWSVSSSGDPAIEPGEFSVVQTCPPERLNCTSAEQITYGQFYREANDGKPFITGVDHFVDIDVSEYTNSLVLSADVSIQQQSVPLTGDLGSECPLMVTIVYKLKSPTDGDQSYLMCVFSGEGDYAQYQGVNVYERVKLFGIYPISVDLRAVDAPIKDAWSIQRIRIEARGHDYKSQITRVSLVGR